MVKIFTTKSSLILENLSPIPKRVPNLKIIDEEGTNVYDLLKYKNIVFPKTMKRK